MFCKVTRRRISQRGAVVPRKNAGLGSYESAVTTFPSTEQGALTLFDVYFLFKDTLFHGRY